MKILEVADRTPDLINQLLEVWKKSVRATHLFLSDREIKNIKAYVPQAKGFYEHMGFHIYKMEAVVSLRRFENMIKRFLKYVDGKKECYFCILNLNKLSEPVPAARRDCT